MDIKIFKNLSITIKNQIIKERHKQRQDRWPKDPNQSA